VIFYPLAYTVPDDVYDKLKRFVHSGGTLYVSGDPCYDTITKKRTKPERLHELCGVRMEKIRYTLTFEDRMQVTSYSRTDDPNVVRHGYPSLSIRPTAAKPLYVTPRGDSVIVRRRLGK